MKLLKKVARCLADVLEVYLPVVVFVALFLVFLTNIFCRYILKDPQNWTFEFSTYSFVVVGLIGACTAYRKEDHVVFDLVYTRLGSKGQNILRMISYVIVIVFFLVAIPQTIVSLARLPTVTSIMKIPERIIFMSFPVLLVSTVCRSAYRLVMDIKAFRNKTYVQSYNTEAKEALI
jgi:TRAP-type C4-dicarboxylate transport system permease small subunit